MVDVFKSPLPFLYWRVCYIDEGQEMTWKNLEDEEGARASYGRYTEKKAKMLCQGSIVVEKDGDVTMTDEMQKYA